jgi:hypothetical protein
MAISTLWFAPSDLHAGNLSQEEARLTSLSQQIRNNEEEIRHLLETKKHESDPAAVTSTIKAITESYNRLKETTKEYNELRLHVRFNHPEIDTKTAERKYSRYQVKSLKEIEAAMGLEGRLSRVKARVLGIFPIPESDAAAYEREKKARAPAAVIEDDKPDRIHLVK